MITETIGIQLKYSKDTEVYTSYDTKLEIESEVSKLLFSLFHKGKIVDFRIVDEDILAIEQEPQVFKWCTDCREYDQEKHCCHRWSRVIRDTVAEMKQEPKTGHWIVAKGSYLGMRNACCSNCEDFYTNDWNAMNYCPNCGAKMVENEEE